jgi:hypothetical protein
MPDSSWEEALFVDRISLDPDTAVTPFVAMQRVVIRMLFDPAFVESVYRDSAKALADVELDDELVTQLLANDRRLWNSDRLRRWRALKILMDEFKVASTLVLRETRELDYLDQFFSSGVFHISVQQRGYMALAFVRYLEDGFDSGRLASPHTRAALALEALMARSRRELRDAERGYDRMLRRGGDVSGDCVVALPGVRGAVFPGGTLELIQHIEKYLFQASQVPALALCEDAPTPDPLPDLDESAPAAFLLEPENRGKVELSQVSATIARLVDLLDSPIAEAEVSRRAADSGIETEDLDDLVLQLIDGGVLRRVRLDD